MANNYGKHLTSKVGKNSAGGESFEVDCWTRLTRFLILGSEGGSYYASEQQLTRENASVVEQCLNRDGRRTVEEIVRISEAGCAPKNTPAILALAMACSHSDDATRKLALDSVVKVCRTGTHLFEFVELANAFRGWGRGLRRAVARWYTEKTPDQLAFQILKYKNRNDWSHRDILRLAGGEMGSLSPSDQHHMIFRYLANAPLSERSVTRNGIQRVYPEIHVESWPAILEGDFQIRNSPERAIQIIHEYRLTHEMVPNDLKKNPQVWEALLPHMPLAACLRNLGRMTAIGYLAPMSKASRLVCEKITNLDAIKGSRIHPLNYLVALNTYASGRGVKGSLHWDPVQTILDALEEGFELSFGTVKPSNKRELIALDVSGSMSAQNIAGMAGITPRIGSAAMSMIQARTEQDYQIMAFTNKFVPLSISKKDSLDTVIRKISHLPFGQTNCALPMWWAMRQKIPVDTFYVYTDSETASRGEIPAQALRRYRDAMGIPAKLVVVGMVSNGFSIADPKDRGMLDVVGFDTAAPTLMKDFSREGIE